MLTLLLGPALAFLPARWRARWLVDLRINWPAATQLSGIAEMLAALVMLVVWYSLFVNWARPSVGAHFGPWAGLIGYLSFWTHPVTWLIAYFGVEGVVRFLAGLAVGESPGTLPLVLLDRAIVKWQSPPVPPLIPDLLSPADSADDCNVASCRAKPAWKYPLTIRYQGDFFQVQGQEYTAADSSRPFVYRLRRLPANQIIRGLEEYDPSDVLREDEPPGFFAWLLGEIQARLSAHAARRP